MVFFISGQTNYSEQTTFLVKITLDNIFAFLACTPRNVLSLFSIRKLFCNVTKHFEASVRITFNISCVLAADERLMIMYWLREYGCSKWVPVIRAPDIRGPYKILGILWSKKRGDYVRSFADIRTSGSYDRKYGALTGSPTNNCFAFYRVLFIHWERQRGNILFGKLRIGYSDDLNQNRYRTDGLRFIEPKTIRFINIYEFFTIFQIHELNLL